MIQWPAPKNIKAYCTTRYPGKSVDPYAEFNLALHVGDDKECVLKNRQDLMQRANLPSTPKWLNQTHSNIALLAETISSELAPNADASYTQKPNEVCVVMTADCLPILVTNKAGTEVAAIHAGWQGLAAGVIENTLLKLSSKPSELLIWIGPSIHQANYEVGEDFYMKFAETHSQKELNAAFVGAAGGRPLKWLANVPLLAVQRLIRLGVNIDNIYLSNECTYANPEKYFSYRRDAATGRMASLIWISL
ncbi:MAG: peptidoglycan editing factor PgeF [Pseudomonadota bacterium]